MFLNYMGIMEKLGRRGRTCKYAICNEGYMRLEFKIPARDL